MSDAQSGPSGSPGQLPVPIDYAGPALRMSVCAVDTPSIRAVRIRVVVGGAAAQGFVECQQQPVRERGHRQRALRVSRGVANRGQVFSPFAGVEDRELTAETADHAFREPHTPVPAGCRCLGNAVADNGKERSLIDSILAGRKVSPLDFGLGRAAAQDCGEIFAAIEIEVPDQDVFVEVTQRLFLAPTRVIAGRHYPVFLETVCVESRPVVANIGSTGNGDSRKPDATSAKCVPQRTHPELPRFGPSYALWSKKVHQLT